MIKDFKKYNESIFSPLKNLLSFVKDFKAWSKEHKDVEFKSVRNIINFLQNYNIDQFIKNKAELDHHLNLLLDELKIEDEKEYSERKYELIDEIKLKYQKFREKRQKNLEEIVMEYYKKYAGDLISDLDNCIEWVKDSKWYDDEYYYNLLIRFRNVFNDSDIEKELQKYTDFI